MSIVADHYRFVVGVDTHAATYSYEIIECPSGRVTDESRFPTTSAGLERAITWLARRTDGDVDGVLIAAEGTGSYGAILADRLERIGYRVVEAPTPSVIDTVSAATGSAGLSQTSSANDAFADCDDARAAGRAPLFRREPGYQPSLDPDGDGFACPTV
ncbi:excalibur calcium-binding domain-containing protein [Nocardia vinacea]|uniref:excalibur calcium-binding domain-containing protein n=1 Tax=Nocardia vinacea TaxID=96468 RepID=UPI0002D757C8|nr:excalibur calcium-binding domain-containing protein [Nocardia vinacea]